MMSLSMPDNKFVTSSLEVIDKQNMLLIKKGNATKEKKIALHTSSVVLTL